MTRNSAETPLDAEAAPVARSISSATARSSVPASPLAFQGGKFHIPSLDGIRALAFLTVFLGHAGLGSFVPGYFGLNLFFFLSGYLITTLMRMEFDRGGDVSFRQFYLRRALRILPPFYLVLFVAYGLTLAGLLGGELNVRGVVSQVCHVTNYYIVSYGWWDGIAPGTWVYWSLAVEEHFYLAFPLLYLAMRRRLGSGASQAKLLLALCGLVLAWRCLLIFGLGVPKDRVYVASDTRVDSILVGCLLAVWKNPIYEVAPNYDRRLLRVWLPLGAIAVVVGLVVRVHEFDQTFRYTLQGFGLIPFFMAAIRFHDRGPCRLLNTPLMRRIGLYSYSMYLMHTTLLWGAERWLPDVPIAVRSTLALAALLALGAIIYRFIERPFAGVRRRLAHYLA